MKTHHELTEIMNFISEYASIQIGSGVHTSRVVRNTRRMFLRSLNDPNQGMEYGIIFPQWFCYLQCHSLDDGWCHTPQSYLQKTGIYDDQRFPVNNKFRNLSKAYSLPGSKTCCSKRNQCHSYKYHQSSRHPA